MSEEIWKDIRGCEGVYEISNQGRLKKKGHIVKDTKPNCFISNWLTSPEIKIPKKEYFRHILVAQTFLDNEDDLPIVKHKSGNPLDNRVENLYWCGSPESRKDKNKLVDITTGIVYGSILEASIGCYMSKMNIEDSIKTKTMSKGHEFVWIYSRDVATVEEKEVENFWGEKWSGIPGFDDLYLISNFKRVQSIKSGRFLSVTNGYVTLSYNNVPFVVSVNQLIEELFGENPA